MPIVPQILIPPLAQYPVTRTAR